MGDFDTKLKNFAIELFKINAIKFGNYKMKIGIDSPIYCDLRMIVSYPKLLDTLSQLLIEKIESIESVKLLCGVPYTALPIATAMSIKTGIPMVLRRKEAKDYGTKKLIEGNFEVNDNCLIVEDVVTSGSSILETVRDLKDAGLSTSSAIVVLNREQGGIDKLKSNGVHTFSLLTITQLLKYLLDAKCIKQEIVDQVHDYLKATQIPKDAELTMKIDRLRLSYLERIPYTKNNVAKKLFQIMHDKQTNLCVAADLTSSKKLLELAEKLGPKICIFKTHIDILEDFNTQVIEKLKSLATAYNFLIMEDRKYADIGKTVMLQYGNGIYKISTWADLITVHPLPGNGIIQALNQCNGIEMGIFLVAEMSSAGNLITETYTSTALKFADDFPKNIAGIVGQSSKFVKNAGIIQLTPGIQLNNEGDKLGQQYNSPDVAILERGADIGVVGRGITQAENPASAAEQYRKLLWEAYLKRTSNH